MRGQQDEIHLILSTELQNMDVQCSANYIDCFGLRNFFKDSVRRAFRQHTMQELGNRMQTRETPIYTFYPTLGLHTHTGGLKGWGCPGP